MSQWESVVVTDPNTGQKSHESVEVGLSPGQTGGYVGGSYVTRPSGSDTSTTYYSHEAKKEQNVYRDPQTQKGITADEAIRRGLEGGWRIGDTYYLTEQAARSDMQRLQAITGMPRASGAATPQEIMLKKKGYKAYTTIEGTTIYTRPNAQEIIIPKYGKMIPVEEFRRLHPTPFMKAGMAFSEKEIQLAEKLGLKGIIDPALKTYRHAQFLAEYDPKYKKYGGKQSDWGKKASEFAIGFSEGVRDKPLTAAGNFAFALLVTKGAGALVSKVPALAAGIGTGKVARNINAVNVLGASLASMYGYDVTTRYAAAPDKAKFLGELTATELVPFAAGGYIGTRKLPIQYESVKAPSGEVLWRGVSVGDRPLIGASKQARLILGQPKPGQIPQFKVKEYMPVTKLETNIMARKSVMEAFGYSQKEIAKVDIGLKLMRETETQMSKFTETRLLRGTKSMSEKGTDVFLKYVGEQKAVVDKIYGSFGARSQLKPEYRRLPGDIDIQLTTNEAGAVKFAKELAARLRSSGEQVRISKDNPTLIETYGKAGEHHAIDIHYKGEPKTDILTPGEEVSRYGLKLGQKSIKIEGYDIMPLSEQGIRKGASVLTWRQEGKVAPAAHRLKDIPDFMATQITLLESKYGIIPNNHQKLINEWLKLFPEAKGIKGDVKLPLYQRVEVKPSSSLSLGVPASLKLVKPSQPVSTSSGAKNYSSQFVASVSSSVSALSRSTSAAIKIGGGFMPAPGSLYAPTKRTLSKTVSKPTLSKPASKPSPSKPVSKSIPYKSSPVSTPTPRKLPPLKLKDFSDEIDSLSKRRKKGKYIWDVHNPVPTLKQILGSTK